AGRAAEGGRAGRATELGDGDLHRDPGPKRRVKEDEPDGPPRQTLARRSRAELLAAREQRLETLLREALGREEVPHRTRRNSSRKRPISCAVRTSGGSRRRTSGRSLPPTRKPRSIRAWRTGLPGRSSTIPRR